MTPPTERDRRLQLVPEASQERISGDMTECVVVGLEAVEVEQHQEQRRLT